MNNSYCEKCSLHFGKKIVFDLHLSLVHGEKIGVKNEPQISKETFQVHQRNQEDFSDRVSDICFKCDVCDSIFKTKQNLERHVASVHEGRKPFKCDFCNANFAHKHQLKRHVASVHENKKPFKCDSCDASFARKDKLNGHIASVHEKTKPFKCDFCDTSFAQKD